MKSMSPTEYSVLFALFRLKKRGVNSASFTEIWQEVNAAQKNFHQPSMSFQLVYYYLTRLAKQPFICRENGKVAKYHLKHGLWKIPQMPPLCIYIDDTTQILITCPKAVNCKKQKPDADCPPILTMKKLVKIPPEKVSSKVF